MQTKHIPSLALVLFTLPATTLAAGNGYWSDQNGESVHDINGDCVGALYHGTPFEKCGAPPAPEPTPAPVVAPAPVVTAPPPAPADSDNDGVPDSADRCAGTPAGSRVDSSGCAEKIVVQNLSFASNSSELNAESKAALDGIAESIRNNPTVARVMVTGHSDDRGAAEYNKWLSGKRAQSVADYLVSRGVDAKMVSSEGMGEARPIADNATAEGRRANRRVEIDLK